MLSLVEVADVVMSWKCWIPEGLAAVAGLALAAVRPVTVAAPAATTLTTARTLLLNLTMTHTSPPQAPELAPALPG